MNPDDFSFDKLKALVDSFYAHLDGLVEKCEPEEKVKKKVSPVVEGYLKERGISDDTQN